MEDCFICRDKKEEFKKLPCEHKLCYYCFIRLAQTSCPFCRAEFEYSYLELNDRKKTGIYYKNDIPSPLITPNYYENNTGSITPLNITNSNRSRVVRRNNVDILEIPFSRIERKRIRNRRRNLTKEEVLERRRITKKRIKRKWEKKEGRYRKLNWWDVPVN